MSIAYRIVDLQLFVRVLNRDQLRMQLFRISYLLLFQLLHDLFIPTRMFIAFFRAVVPNGAAELGSKIFLQIKI